MEPWFSNVPDSVPTLALVLSKPDIQAEAIAQLLKQYPTVILAADEVAERGKALLAWINTRYPGATLHTELPFSNPWLQLLKIPVGLYDLLVGVHHERSVACHRFADRPARDQ